MAKKIYKNCPIYDVSEKGYNLNKLEFLPALSKNLGTISISTYMCNGDHLHEPHLLRLEDTNTIITTKTFAIPQNSRMRLFQRKAGKWELHCPIARSQMRFQPTMTNDMGEPTVDIFRCLGTAHGHFSHFVKLQHGKIKIGKMEIGILVATRELRKKIDRDYQTKLTKGEYFNLVNRVWKNDVIKYQPNTIHELVKKKLSRS